MMRFWAHAQIVVSNLPNDCKAVAATEFALIVPLMLVMFFGTVEVSSGVAVDRKVALVARTMSDLTSQSTSVTNTDIDGFILTADAMLTPYDATPLQVTITELWIDPATKSARVQWSRGSAQRPTSSIVPIDPALAVPNQYLIWSEIKYQYVPIVGYVLAKTGVPLSQQNYTRPRQTSCVLYNTAACPTS